MVFRDVTKHSSQLHPKIQTTRFLFAGKKSCRGEKLGELFSCVFLEVGRIFRDDIQLSPLLDLPAPLHSPVRLFFRGISGRIPQA